MCVTIIPGVSPIALSGLEQGIRLILTPLILPFLFVDQLRVAKPEASLGAFSK